MSTLPTNPLAAIVAAARATLPPVSGATEQARQVRLRPRAAFVLADVSASMAESAGARRKIDVLDEALGPVRGNARLIAFGAEPREIEPGRPLPWPSGSTALHLALAMIARHNPTHVLVISDGHPDDPRAALMAADRLGPVRIDVIYCGPEGDYVGIDFMRRLARGGGSTRLHDLARAPKSLPGVVAGLLAAPK